MRNIIHRMNPSEQDIRSLRGALDLLVRRGRPEGREKDEDTRS
jgi:hypothetical protein